MTSLFRRAAEVLGALPAPWRHRADLHLDHGHVPYGAWEAELTAYARLRTESSVKVHFSIAGHTGWTDDITLARPGVAHGQALDDAFRRSECDLEHALMHYRHGWRETALLWHAWSHAHEKIALPWPPWDEVTVPANVVRTALAQAIPELALPPGEDIVPERRRSAARWIAAAWQDGTHRAIELDARPGLSERLPSLTPERGKGPWPNVLAALASRQVATGLPGSVTRALGAALEVNCQDQRGHVAAVLGLTEALAAARLLPPVPEQRPAWLMPAWGRWRRAEAVQAALEGLVRSPDSAAMASLATAARAARQRSVFGGSGRGLAGGTGSRPTSQGNAGVDEARKSIPAEPAEAHTRPESDWGLRPDNQLPSRAEPTGESAGQPRAEGGGDSDSAGSGSGPGALGALHVLSPSPEDRSAYWQLRGALAPEIERLVARLTEQGDAYYANAPKRFRRHGRLDRTRLTHAMRGRENVFTQFVHIPEPEHALCLILDCSASMQPYAEQLREMAILVESAATATGARVTAFSFGAAWERMEPASAGAPLLALGRELRPRGGTPFGPALGAAGAWLARQPFERKRLWIFSDGRWSARDRAESGWRPEHLADAVVWVLTEPAPEPPHPAMRVVATPTLEALIEQAPRYFWTAPDDARRAALPR